MQTAAKLKDDCEDDPENEDPPTGPDGIKWKPMEIVEWGTVTTTTKITSTTTTDITGPGGISGITGGGGAYIEGAEKLNYSHFTIVVYFRVTEQRDRELIVGQSDCGGFALENTTRGLRFGVLCRDMISLGYYVKRGEDVLVAVTYEKDSDTLIAYVNGVEEYREIIDFEFVVTQRIQIGGNWQTRSDLFHGVIHQMQLLSYIMTIEQVVKYYENMIRLLPSGGSHKHTVKISKKRIDFLGMTVDNRLCVSKCIRLPIPGTPGSPVMPPDAYIFVNPINPNCGGSGFCIPDIIMPEPSPVDPTLPERVIKNACEEKFDPNIYKGDLGAEFRIRCPKKCLDSELNVIGSQIYQWESYICQAAIHDGKITNEGGGEFIIRVGKYISDFISTNSHGITSSATTYNTVVRTFTLDVAPEVIQLKCTDTADSEKMKKVHERYKGNITIKCPGKCDQLAFNVFGNMKGFYGGSSICQAGIIAGAYISRESSVEVVQHIMTIRIGVGLPEYPGWHKGSWITKPW